MIPGEEFYPALKKLSEYPEWKEYERWLDSRVQELFKEFLNGQGADLASIRTRVLEIERIQFMLRQLIKEVEDSHKNR